LTPCVSGVQRPRATHLAFPLLSGQAHDIELSACMFLETKENSFGGQIQ